MIMSKMESFLKRVNILKAHLNNIKNDFIYEVKRITHIDVLLLSFYFIMFYILMNYTSINRIFYYVIVGIFTISTAIILSTRKKNLLLNIILIIVAYYGCRVFSLL